MRVATWNIWGRFGPWEQRAAGIEATLRRLDADVICLQEVWATEDQCQADLLAAALDHNAVTSAGSGSGRPMGNAILSRWPITESAVTRLPMADGGPGPRSVVRVGLDAPHGPASVHCTHLAYRFDESALRHRQLAEACRLVAADRGDPATDFPPILCGDLNAVPDSDEIRALTGEAPPHEPGLAFTDAWATVGNGPGHTWDARNPHLGATTWPRRRLDYVMVGWPRPKPFGNPLRARLFGARSHDGVWPSDHLGVVVDFSTERADSHR